MILSMNFLNVLYIHIKIDQCLTPRKMLFGRHREQEHSVSQECSKFQMIRVLPRLPHPPPDLM